MIAGLGGGLDPQLNVGDVVVDAPAEIIPAGLPFKMLSGEIYTTTGIVGHPQEKTLLFEQTGASAVDMETSIVRDEAHRLGLPLLALRAISDAAGDSIDPVVSTFITTVGRPKPAAICMGLARRPWLLPQMRRLNASSKIALANLGAAVAALVMPGAEPWWFPKTNRQPPEAAPQRESPGQLKPAGAGGAA
jgi:hypothetical protein